MSEDEIHHLVSEAESAGVLEPGEKEMIAGVMRLGDRPVGAVMTPRTEVDEIDLNDDPGAIQAIIAKSPHSRFPVSDGDRDSAIGVLQAKDLLGRLHERTRRRICASWSARRRAFRRRPMPATCWRS